MHMHCSSFLSALRWCCGSTREDDLTVSSRSRYVLAQVQAVTEIVEQGFKSERHVVQAMANCKVLSFESALL